MCSRSILIKAVYRLWCEGDTWDQLFESLKSLPASFTTPYYDVLFGISIHLRNHKVGDLI